METEADNGASPARRTAIALGVATLFLAFLVLLWEAFFFVLLVFAGVLFGVFLDGATRLVDGRLPGPRKLALTVVVIVLFGGAAVGLRYLGPALGEQIVELARTVPDAASEVRTWLGERSWGQAVLERLPPTSEWVPRTNDMFGRVTGFFSSTVGLLTNVLIVLFLGLWGAASPSLYTGPLERLFPSRQRERVGEVLAALGVALRSWLGGRLASMAAVAVLTAVGLLVLGVPLALGLAVLAGLLSFVPFLGPVVSAVPAALVAFVERPSLALWVIGLYSAVQLVETYLITPLIQLRAVSLPPAALLAAQILMGLAGGVLGILLATPIAVSVVVLVQMLWLEDVLGDEVELAGS